MRKSLCGRNRIKAGLEKIDVALRAAFVFLIQSYRVMLSPHFGSCCRFYPSCSAYAQETIRASGVMTGIFLTMIRLLKCQPLHPGGIDVAQSRT